MIPIKDISKNVVFEEKSHTYKVGDKKLVSITQLLSEYKKPFDESGIIAYSCAKREGITKQEILKRWETKKNDAAARGTKFHLQAEHLINTGEILDEGYGDILQQFKDLNLVGDIYSEVVLYDLDYGIAGTSDVIQLFDDNSVIVWDFKSNERLDRKPRYGGKLLHPLSEIGDSHLETYSLQLWCYSIMLEKFGYKIKETPKILWINHATRKLEVIQCFDFKNQALSFLNHYKSINLF